MRAVERKAVIGSANIRAKAYKNADYSALFRVEEGNANLLYRGIRVGIEIGYVAAYLINCVIKNIKKRTEIVC